jgi:outer membrane cobalamin receptor
MRIMRCERMLAVLLIGVVLAGAGVAFGMEPRAVVIDTVTVTASPILAEEDVVVYGGAVTSVGRQQVEDLNAGDLPSALRLLPGVTISRYNLLGSYGGGEGGAVYIRGQGAGRPGSEIKVYVDGVPREVGVWSHPVMDIVPTDYASNIEVYKGPQPYSYPGTFGAVDITTARRHKTGYETSLDLNLGDYRTRGGVVRHGGRIANFDYYTGATFKQSDGHRAHADGRIESQFVRLGLATPGSGHLSYIVQHTDNWSRDPGRVDGPTPERDRFATETLTHDLRLDHDGGMFKGFAVMYYEDGRIRWQKDLLNGPETPAGSSDTDWENYGFRGSEDISLGDLALTVGLEIEDEGGEARNTTLSGFVPFQYKGRFTTTAPALAARYRIAVGSGEVIPSVGLRYYGHSRFDSEAAPHAGLMYRRDAWKVFAAYARGVSYPGVYTVGVAAETIDDLGPEVLDHMEAGVNASLGGLMKLQVSVFHDRSDNLMQYTPGGLVNVRAYEVRGLEVSSTLRPNRDLSLYGALTLLDPEETKTPRTPAVSVAAGANFKPAKRLRLTADAEYVAEQYAFNGRSGIGEIADIEELPSYFVASAGAGYDISGYTPLECEISLTVENLTGEVYAFQPGYKMPGRTVSLSARLGLE